MPTNHLAVAGLIFLTAAAVSRRVYASKEGILAAGLCGEESRACAATGGISDLSSVIDDLPKAKTEERWAGGKKGKRKRQVGFSHEDVAGDEFLRPFVQVFRDSLSGSAKGNDLRAPQDASELMSAKDTSIPAAAEGDEVMVRDNSADKGIRCLELPATFFECREVKRRNMRCSFSLSYAYI